MTKHKNVALDELRILAALMVLGVHTGQKVAWGMPLRLARRGYNCFLCSAGTWPRPA